MRRSLWFSLGMAFLAIWSALLAYYRIFAGFSEWDDEGTLMMTVRQFLTGSTLYEIVHSGYGPVYYYFNWLIRTITFTGVSHDTTRITSMVLWTLSAMACAWIVWRVGRSVPVALLTHFLVFRTLSFFFFEPGHPQELCMVLMVALAASGLPAESDSGRPIAIFLAGALPAALLLVKVNIGIFAAMAVAIAMLNHVPRGPVANALRYLAGGAAAIFPFLLMRTHLQNASEIAYCVAVIAGTVAVLAASTAQKLQLSLRDCGIAAAAFVGTCAIVLAILVIQGAAPSTILDSLVLDQIKLRVKQGNWYLPAGLSPWWILWAFASPAIALFTVRNRKQSTGAQFLPPLLLIVLSGAALALASTEGNQLLGMVTPFCWIVAYPLREDRPRLAYARTLLAATAVLQTLYAYPVAGSQAPFARVLLVVVAGICLADALRDLPESLREGVMAKGLAAAVVAGILLSYPGQVWRARQVYAQRTPLDLPGAGRIHVDPQEAATLQWVVSQLETTLRHIRRIPRYSQPLLLDR